MAFNRKHLTSDEVVELEFRTHIKRIFGPIALLVLYVVLMVLAVVFVPDSSARLWILIAVAVVLLVAAVVTAVVPILAWRNEYFVVTNRRMITRKGILNKSGRDIPLYRVNDVSYDKDLSDRIFHCGTLNISDASDQPTMRLDDIPHVEDVQLRISELLFADPAHDDRRGMAAGRGPAQPEQPSRPARGGRASYDQQPRDFRDLARGPQRSHRDEVYDDRAYDDRNYDNRDYEQQNYDHRDYEQRDYEQRGYDERDGRPAPRRGSDEPFDYQQYEQTRPIRERRYERPDDDRY